MTFSLRAATLEDVPTLAAFQCAMALETEDHVLPEAVVTAGIKGLISVPARAGVGRCRSNRPLRRHRVRHLRME